MGGKEVSESYELYNHILKTLVLDGNLTVNDVHNAYHRNVKNGYKFMVGQDKYLQNMTSKFEPNTVLEQDIANVIRKFMPVKLDKIPLCPMFYSAYLNTHDPPLKHDYDILKKLVCQKRMCEWWDEKKGKCSQVTTRNSLISKKSLEELRKGSHEKPTEYLPHPECLTCENYETDECYECSRVPKHYKRG